MKSTVFRIEQSGEVANQYPTLASAMRMPPRNREACIVSSDGTHLADALPCSAGLCWRLTMAGGNVADDSGSWTLSAPTLSPEEYDTALAIALGDELQRVAS
jgi:hypothetical protein